MSAPASAYSYLKPNYRVFWLFFGGSMLFHVLLIAGLAFAQGKRRPVIDLTENAIQTKLVKLGKKRDPKLLPRKQKAPAPKPAEKQLAVASEPEPAPPETPDKRDKMEEALKKIEAEAERKRQREQALARIADQVGEDEEEGDPEGSRHGTETQAQSMTLAQAYYARLHDRVKDFYNVPAIISEAERRRLEAVVVVYVGPDGTLLKHEIERSSGNDAFDRALEAALVRASPLPAPPAFLRETLRDGIGLRFRP